MPWFNIGWSDFIKKRVCKFLLNRYLGQFLEEKLTIEQLNVDFYNGRGTVHNISLYCEAINNIFESQGWDFEVIEGQIGSVCINVPWHALMTEDSFVEVNDLYLCLRPHPRTKDEETTMLESMWSSMSSSMQLAQECLEKKDDSENVVPIATANTMEGLEKFAQTIDNILNRIKAKFINTVLRLEYLPKDSDVGVAIVIKIKNLEYQNETSSDPADKENADKTDNKSFLLSTYASHHIILDDITFYTEEFRINDTESNLNEEKDQCEEETIHSGNENQIMFCRIQNRQEIRLNMKLAEHIEGPKVELQMTIGALILYLSPRQLHLLLLFCNILLNQEETSDNDDRKEFDESELDKNIRKIQNINANGILANQVWSSADPYEDFRNNSSEYAGSDVHCINTLHPIGSDSVFSSNSSMSSSIGSSASQGTSKRKRAIERDINADISRLNIRLAGIYLVLLHDNVLTESRSFGPPLNKTSVEKFSAMSERFFNAVTSEMATISKSDLTKIGKLFSDVMDNSNHLRIMFAPFLIEGEERRTIKGNRTKLNISVSRGSIDEVVGNVIVPILDFIRKDSTAKIPERPEIVLNMEKTNYFLKSSTGKKYMAPRLNIGLTLEKVRSEFDITIIDRLNSLFTSPFECFMPVSASADDSFQELSKGSQKVVQSKTEIKINTEWFNFILRFPVLDMRPIHDPEKTPWWQRNVRSDYLQIQFSDFRLTYLSSTIFDILADKIDIYYNETDKSQPIHLGKATTFESTNKYYSGSIEYPRIVIEFPSQTQLNELNESYINQKNDGKFGDDTDSDPTSGESIKINTNRTRESTPFSAKKVCRESETPHAKENDDDSETLLLPGDSEEMGNFCEKALKFAKFQIQVYLPIVSLQLKSKHLYEVIYNRIIMDLLMWESNAPSTKTEPSGSLQNPEVTLMSAGMMDSVYAPYTMCKSTVNFESSSSVTNSESESDNDTVFYSIHEKSRASKRVIPIYQTDYSSATAFKLHIGQGMVTLYSPVRDSQNHVIPGQLGEFIIKVSNMNLFTVSNYLGNTNLGYVCMQSKSAEIYHCGLIPVPVQNPPLREINCMLPSHMKSTLYPTPKNLTLNDSKGSSKREMFSMAVQIKLCPDQGLKRIKISVGVQNTTLRHYSTLHEHMWLTQVMDMFDVVDYTVPGYTPNTVLTELHMHLWDCSIDYRPLHYPFRAIAHIDTFMVSSNISASSTGCTLRFVAEDVSLCLAPYNINSNEKREDQKITALPKTDLICVLQLGLFEISLKLNEKVTSLFPKFDLRASIRDVHIRTCSDSGRALLEFIGYLASEGDLVKEQESYDDKSQCSLPIKEEDDDNLLQMKSSGTSIPEVTLSQQNHVTNLMADAMVECTYKATPGTSRATASGNDGHDIEVFFFPDEDEKNKNKKMDKCTKLDSHKRRCASEDSISMDSSTYRDDDDVFVQPCAETSEDQFTINSEMKDLLDFETSVMVLKGENDPLRDYDPLPQVKMELGDIQQIAQQEQSNIKNEKSRKYSSDTDDDFCFVAEEEKPSYTHNEIPTSDGPIRIVDNHFSLPVGKPDLLKAPKNFPMAVQRYTLCDLSLTWYLYGGHDFPTEEDKKKEKAEKEELSKRTFSTHLPMSEAYKMGVSYSKGSPNVQLGNPLKLTWKTRGGYGRKHDVLMEIIINKVRFSHELYPTTTEQASRQVLLITELEIRDRLAISNINKFLYHPTAGALGKQESQHVVVIKALHLRPDPAIARQECCLRISLLPLRLNIDQDSLLFLINFFHELSGGSDDDSQKTDSSMAVKVHEPPVMMVELPEAAQELQARKMVSENLSLLLNEDDTPKESSDPTTSTNSDSPIFFRHVIFSPDVSIRFDYQGKRVELSHGPLAGLLMGLGQLQCSEIRLKRISYRHGILGIDRLVSFLLHEWLNDIKKRQLPKILGGVGPMYSLVQLFQGIFDLFWLPIEQYQKDGRLVRGIQRGAQSFTARTALAALEITSRIIHLLQITAETAYDMVSPGPSLRRRPNRKGKRKRIHPPQDIREGIANAYQIFKDGIGDTALQIMENTALEHDQKGFTGAVGAVIRQVPPTVVRPVVLVTQATSNVLGGVKNSLNPDARYESKEKYKKEDE